MRPHVSLRVLIGSYTFFWVFMGLYRSVCILMEFSGSLLVLIGTYASLFVLMGPYRSLYVFTDSNWTLWVLLGLCSS